MDDQQRQPAQESAQAREKGAALEYDTEDQDALASSSAPPNHVTTDKEHQNEDQK